MACVRSSFGGAVWLTGNRNLNIVGESLVDGIDNGSSDFQTQNLGVANDGLKGGFDPGVGFVAAENESGQESDSND